MLGLKLIHVSKRGQRWQHCLIKTIRTSSRGSGTPWELGGIAMFFGEMSYRLVDKSTMVERYTEVIRSSIMKSR